MIKGILIINNHGKPRLVKFYQSVTDEAEQQSVIRRVFQQVAQRPDSFCNYLEGSIPEWGDTTKIIYRHYATLYFVFAVDQQESDLGILDLIQVFVESLDKCFENVCELDLIFHSDKVNYLLDEIIMAGQSLALCRSVPYHLPCLLPIPTLTRPPHALPHLGMVLETNINHILTSVNEQNKLHAASNKVIGSSSVAGSVSGALGLSGQKR